MNTKVKIEAKTVAASMSCETPAQLDRYYKVIKEYAAKVDAGLITVEEAARYINQYC